MAICRGPGHGEEDEDEDGEEVSRWNLRKCSAAGLDVLSTVFGDEILPIVVPIVQQRLQVISSITLWKEDLLFPCLILISSGINSHMSLCQNVLKELEDHLIADAVQAISLSEARMLATQHNTT